MVWKQCKQLATKQQLEKRYGRVQVEVVPCCAGTPAPESLHCIALSPTSDTSLKAVHSESWLHSKPQGPEV